MRRVQMQFYRGVYLPTPESKVLTRKDANPAFSLILSQLSHQENIPAEEGFRSGISGYI